MEDVRLLEKIKEAEETAFQELFETYKQPIFNLCCRMLDNQEEAEDVTQDVFFSAYKSLKQFRAESQLSTWLYRIAVNLCLNYQRRKKQARWFSLDFLPPLNQPEVLHSCADSPDKALEKAQLARLVQRAINSLPTNQRVAIILQRYEDLSYEQIAKTMNCSVSSVESYLYRAKQNLVPKLISLLKKK